MRATQAARASAIDRELGAGDKVAAGGQVGHGIIISLAHCIIATPFIQSLNDCNANGQNANSKKIEID
ncbi:MAG: hypothetical protein KDK39_16295 [Leptospiraceae bacterium]|nr:hypothetical protein [Leptospiraceae bacterium]